MSLTPEGSVFREFEDSFSSSLPSSLTIEERDIIIRNAVSIGLKVLTKLPSSIKREFPLLEKREPPLSEKHPPSIVSLSEKQALPIVPSEIKSYPPVQPIVAVADRPKRSMPFPPIPPLTTPKTWKKWTDAQFMALTRDTQSWVNHRVSTEEEVLDWYDLRHHLLILYTIAKCVNWPDPRDLAPKQPPTVLEIGVRHGISTLALLTAMRETGGRLISLEIDPEWGQDATDVVRRAQLDRWWQLEICDSGEYRLLPGTVLDVLWIDGSHDEQDVRRDFNRYSPYVRHGGFILMHDYYQYFDRDGEDLGVRNVVEAARMSGMYEVLVLPFSHGLAMLRVL